MKKIILSAISILILLSFTVFQLNNEKMSKITSSDNVVTPVPIQKSNEIKTAKNKSGPIVENIQQENANSETIVKCKRPVDTNDLSGTKYFDANTVKRGSYTDILIPKLTNSIEMESQIANALMTPTDDAKDLINTFKELQTIFPDNTLLSYDLLSSCTTPENDCNDSVFNNGIELESQNGAVWLLSAINEINRNNIDAAINALLEASSASYYEEYWGEHFSLFQDAFNQSGAENSLAIQIATVSYVASASIPNYGPLVNFCKTIDADRADVLDACLYVGQHLSNGEKTSLTHLIGLSLRKAVYERYDDSAQLNQIAQELSNFLKIQSQSNAATALVWKSRQRTSEWIEQLKISGEVAATEYIVKQALSLSSNPDFDPCLVDW